MESVDGWAQSRCPARAQTSAIAVAFALLLSRIAASAVAAEPDLKAVPRYEMEPELVAALMQARESPDELAAKMKDRILSLHVHAGAVFATTANGLFRCSPQVKRWERVTAGHSFAPLGVFGKQPANCAFILYFVPPEIYWPVDRARRLEPGLYRFDPRGRNWELLCNKYDFFEWRQEKDGAVYALAAPKTPLDAHVSKTLEFISSNDGGKNWRDISNGSCVVGYPALIDDPDHKDLVCLCCCQSQGTHILQADDKRYRWKGVKEVEWERRHPSTFFSFPQYRTATTLFMYNATLSNYFSYPFGDEIEVPSFQVTVAGSLKFAKKSRIIVPIEVAFRSNDSERAVLVDAERGRVVWGLRRMLPDGTREEVAVPENEPPATTTITTYLSGVREIVPAEKAVRPAPADLRLHILGSGESYKRTLNLSAMCDFSTPGKYRVQLVYGNSSIADDKKGEWVGSFSSPAFELEVVP